MTTKLARRLVACVGNAAGQLVVSIAQAITLAAGCDAPYFLRLTMPQSHLWSGQTP